MERIQIISIIVSISIFSAVFNLVRRKKLKTEYLLIWILVWLVFIVFSFWKNGIDTIANLLGIAYAPSVLFIILIIGIILILIEFSIIISKQAERIKVLTQEIGLLKQEFEKEIDKEKEKSE